MGCVSEDDLLEYVERRLPPEHLAETEAHLRNCTLCRGLLAEIAPESNEGGTGIAGRYEVIGPLGAGGMSVVYAARDAKLRRTVALKMLRPGGAGDASDAKMRQRLLREARAMAQLSHPNVVPVYDVGELGGEVFVAMELVDGSSLRTWLSEKRRDWRDVLGVFLDAARGLSAAHSAGIIHRDFKPDNVLVGKDGRVRVTDFGLASAVAQVARAVPDKGRWEPVLSLTGTALAGSPAYMAPEQMRGDAVDARADVFSYCVALHEGLYGERPFAGDSLADLNSAILRGEVRKPRRANGAPARIWRAIVRGLNAAPDSRFQSMEGVIAALERDRPGRWLWGAVGVAALSALVAIAWKVHAPMPRPALATKSVAQQPQTVQDGHSESRDLVLRAKVLLHRRNEADTKGAIRLLEQAASADPDFALAQAQLSFAYSQYVSWFAPEDKAALERSEVAVAKAPRLNPDLPEAHHAVAGLVEWALPPRYTHDRAVRELKRALELDPNYGEGHRMLGNIYYHIGLVDAALVEFGKSSDFDPTGQNDTRVMAMVLLSRGEYEEALRLFRQVAPEANSAAWSGELAWTLLYLGKVDEARAVIDRFLKANPDDRAGMVTSIRALWYAKAGKVAEAEADIRAVVQKGRGFVHFHHAAYNVASAYALLGRPGPAVEWLRTAADGGWPCYPHYARDPNLAKIRDDPAFIAFLADLRSRWERYRALY
jgi:serine/threonine protein kinase